MLLEAAVNSIEVSMSPNIDADLTKHDNVYIITDSPAHQATDGSPLFKRIGMVLTSQSSGTISIHPTPVTTAGSVRLLIREAFAAESKVVLGRFNDLRSAYT